MENIEKKQTRVFVMCGPAGSGKSTWLIKQMKPKTDVCISRDNIRFILLQEGEDYFAHENEVKEIFFDAIADDTSSSKWENIYIDATHLNKRSRNKTLNRVKKTNIGELNCVCFNTPVELCQARNSLRSGRARVPVSAIDNMFKSYAYPTADEGFTHVYVVDAEGVTKEVNV